MMGTSRYTGVASLYQQLDIAAGCCVFACGLRDVCVGLRFSSFEIIYDAIAVTTYMKLQALPCGTRDV